MTTLNDIFLPICAVCKDIRVSDNPQRWLSRTGNERLYDLFTKEFEKSHTYCPEHAEELIRKEGL